MTAFLATMIVFMYTLASMSVALFLIERGFARNESWKAGATWPAFAIYLLVDYLRATRAERMSH
jgi:hypothetical protein